MADLTDATLGQRVAALRRRNGMSQRDLATALKRSDSWVSQVERDVLPVERVSVLQRLADTLGVSVHDLRPETAPAAEPPERAANDLESLRLAMTGHPTPWLLVSDHAGEPADTAELQQRVDDVWQLTHESRFAELSSALTGIITELETTARQGTRRHRSQASELLARTYQAAAAAFARQDEADAAWVAADRAVTAAEHSADRLAPFAGLYRMAHAFITLRQPEQAERVARNASDALSVLTDKEDCTRQALSLAGAHRLILAVIRAREGDRAGTREHIDQARALAQRLGEDRNDYDTEFGPTNVELHAVSTAVDLGDAGEAVDIAGRLDSTALSPERQARLHMDLATAHAQRRHIGEAIAALLEAERLAPEQVRTHVVARDTIRDLLSLAGRRPPATLTDLADRAGISP